MITGSAHRDPRDIITPDAFEVSEELLGTPLATPSRRLTALLIDLVVVGFLTLVMSSLSMAVGVVAAIFFIRAGFKRTPVKGSVFGRAMRFSVGCLGVFIGLVTAVVWAVFGFNVGFGGNGSDDDFSDPAALIPDVSGLPFAGAIAGLATQAMFASIDDLEDAEEAVSDFLEVAEELGVERGEMLGLLLAAIPDDASWANEAEAAFTRLISPDADDLFASGDELAEDVVASIREEVAEYSTLEALGAYSSLLEDGTENELAGARLEALGARLSDDVASDTIAQLQARIEDVEDRQARTERQLASTQEQLADAGRGIIGIMRNWVAEAVSGIGWWTLYLTVFPSWWNGQTVGKRMMRIRVVRLDGEPITWWVAFERLGGYAAGFATGLLGFAQVFWDANRQGIHDRIVGTVVIMDGAEKVADWESAL